MNSAITSSGYPLHTWLLLYVRFGFHVKNGRSSALYEATFGSVLSCRCLALLLSSLYTGLLYGLHVPDWEINMSNSGLSLPAANGTNIYKVTLVSANLRRSFFNKSLRTLALLYTAIFVGNAFVVTDYKSEDDGQGGRKKKGLTQKIKEKLPGGKHKNEEYSSTMTPGYDVYEEHEKKGIMDKIKDKLPGTHR